MGKGFCIDLKKEKETPFWKSTVSMLKRKFSHYVLPSKRIESKKESQFQFFIYVRTKGLVFGREQIGRGAIHRIYISYKEQSSSPALGCFSLRYRL
jgi:hypothetical protein